MTERRGRLERNGGKEGYYREEWREGERRTEKVRDWNGREWKGGCFSGAYKITENRRERRRREETDSSVEGRSHRVSKGASKRLNRTET